MNQTFFKFIAVLSLGLTIVGCASVAVSNDAIERNTAMTLGLAKSSFTISDRVDDGIKSSYSVKTHAGKQYSCYVTGTVSVTGRVVSDAICQALAQPQAQGKPKSMPIGGGAPCNALLKAAGKCQ